MNQSIVEKNFLEKKNNKKMPLYQQIHRHLRETIQDENYKLGDRLPAISTLTKKWGVNYRTIKLAFEMLEKDGYITSEPNKGAFVAHDGCENNKKTESIMYVRFTCDAFEVAISEGITAFARENDLEFVVYDANRSFDTVYEVIEHPPSNSDGLILIPEEIPDYEKSVKNALRQGRNIVFVDRTLKDIEASSVAADHFKGAYQATEHLLELHNEPVYFFGNVTVPSSSRNRFQGWAVAMRAHNYFNIEPYIYDLHGEEQKWSNTNLQYIQELILNEAIDLFNNGKRSKFAIFAGNDYFARGIYDAAEQLNLKVGTDVFLVGFGDLPLCKKLPVPLTSVWQNSERVGYEAAKILHERNSGTLKKPMNRLLPVELKIRQSSTGTPGNENI